MTKKKPLLLVEWDDVSSFTGWETEENALAKEKPFRAKMVGWEISRNKDYLVLATAFSDDKDCNGRRYIPRGCIKLIRRLEDA